MFLIFTINPLLFDMYWDLKLVTSFTNITNRCPSLNPFPKNVSLDDELIFIWALLSGPLLSKVSKDKIVSFIKVDSYITETSSFL